MIQFLRGTSSQLQSSNQIFAAGQPVFESDSGQLKIGDGLKTFANLPYVGAGLSGGGSINWKSYSNSVSSGDGSVSARYLDFEDGMRLVMGQMNLDLSLAAYWKPAGGTSYLYYFGGSTLLVEAADIVPMYSAIYVDAYILVSPTRTKMYTTSSHAGQIWPEWSYVALITDGDFNVSMFSSVDVGFTILCNSSV